MTKFDKISYSGTESPFFSFLKIEESIFFSFQNELNNGTGREKKLKKIKKKEKKLNRKKEKKKKNDEGRIDLETRQVARPKLPSDTRHFRMI